MQCVGGTHPVPFLQFGHKSSLPTRAVKSPVSIASNKANISAAYGGFYKNTKIAKSIFLLIHDLKRTIFHVYQTDRFQTRIDHQIATESSIRIIDHKLILTLQRRMRRSITITTR